MKRVVEMAGDTPPWVDRDLAADLLRASLATTNDVLGTAETADVCREYLKPQEANVVVRRVTVTGACVATAPNGDVFIPASLLVADKAPVAGSGFRVTMVSTSTGRSAYLALSATEEEDWQVACRRHKKTEKGRRCQGGGRTWEPERTTDKKWNSRR